MAYSDYRSGRSGQGDWNRDRNERWRTHDRERDRDEQYTQSDDDDSRLARESMERDYYGSGGRGGYRSRSHEDPRDREDRGPRYNRGYGQGDYDQDYGSQGGRSSQGGRFSESGYGRGREYLGREGGRHHGNETGGWQGREEEQWRNRDTHGQYDRDANYGGFSSRTGNFSAYGAGGSYQGGESYRGGQSYQGGQGRWGQGGTQYSQGGRGYGDYRSEYQGERQGPWQAQSYGSGRPSGGRAYGDYSGSGYFGEDYGGRSDWQRRGQWGSEQGGSEPGGRAGSPGRGLWGQEQESGQHRGRGPRGYKRSDDRIREEVCDCLTDDDRLDATSIEVSVKDGEVILTGYVIERQDKRWAESLAERVAGVKEVQNSLRVQDQRAQSERSQSGVSPSQSAGSAAAAAGSTTGGTTGGKDRGKESNVQH